MGLAYNTLGYRSDLCQGCGECMTACAHAKTGDGDNLAHSRIRILTPTLIGQEVTGGNEMALCRQCASPNCVRNCPSAALTRDEDTGVIDWDRSKCVDCLLCTVGCAYGGITFDAAVGHVVKCDTCDGDPACAKACPTGALTWRTAATLFNREAEREDLFAPGLSACQGCNSELLIRHTLRHVGRNVVVAAPPGCIPGMGTVGYNGQTGSKVPIFHPLLTNAASMLAGIRRQFDRMGRPVTALALAGDGGTADAGFQAVSGAAERDDPLLYICVDNEGYMNTGMQASGATSFGSWTSTTPVGAALRGKRGEAKNLPVVMMGHGCSYVATASTAFLEDFYAKLDRAIEVSRTGMAYLHVYAPCPTGWRFASHLTTEVCRTQVETNFVTLWEFSPSEGLRFTRPVHRPRPVAEYVRLIGKYKHLNAAELDHIQRTVDERVELLKRFAGP